MERVPQALEDNLALLRGILEQAPQRRTGML